MKYSIVNEERCEPQPGLSGKCPACGCTTIAKCGPIKIAHWAHKGKLICDPWWENETEWHRTWKNYFPVDWQEVIQHDKNGEKHIADVKTIQGWVLEFQHSHIQPEERIARTKFYEKLAWIVDGTRRKRDKEQFFKFLNEFDPVNRYLQVRKVYLDRSAKFGKCALLKEWSGIRSPVFFDFGEEVLWCLLPINQSEFGYIAAFSRREFIELHNKDVDQRKGFDERIIKLFELVIPPSVRKLLQLRQRDVSQTPTTTQRLLARRRTRF